MCGPRDVNSKSKSQKLLDASSFSSRSGNVLEEGLKLPSKPSTGSNLAKVAPFTPTTVVRMCTIATKAIKGAAQKESSATGSEEAATYKSSCNLDYNMSRVTQAQLDVLRALFDVPTGITMKAPASDELLSNACEDGNEILFLIITFNCGVRLSLALFLRQFLSELPLHPFQASSTL